MNISHLALEGGCNYLKVDRDHSSDNVLIVFSHTGYPARKYAMSNALSATSATKIFVNCQNNSWYQQGLWGVTSSIDETARLLIDILRELNPARVICTGMSMGGYAGILFGLKLGCDSICAFTSELVIGKYYSRSYTMNNVRQYDYKYRSLSNLILQNKTTKVYAIYGVYDLIDLSLLWPVAATIENRELFKTFLVSGGHSVTHRLNIPAIIGQLVIGKSIRRKNINEIYCFSDPVGLDEILLYSEIQRLKLSNDRISIFRLLKNHELRPRRPNLCLYYANSCIDLQQFDDAKESLQIGTALDPYGQPLYHAKGILYSNMGDWHKAKNEFLHATFLEPKALKSHYRLGLAFENLGGKSDAELCYRNALKIKPNNPEIAHRLYQLRKDINSHQLAEMFIVKGESLN